MGHYVGQCPQKKKKKQQQTITSTEIEDFTARFEREFSLCTGHVDRERASIITSADVDSEREYSLLTGHSFNASTTNTWYIDSGASSHMTGARDMFFELSQAEIDVEVVLGDDIVVRAVGRGTITFQRESMSPMILRDVLYVTGLKKNLISFSMIEDRGLGVSFLDGHVRVSQVCGPSTSYTIGVRCGKLYKLLF